MKRDILTKIKCWEITYPPETFKVQGASLHEAVRKEKLMSTLFYPAATRFAIFDTYIGFFWDDGYFRKSPTKRYK